jgi:hypothetical protein
LSPHISASERFEGGTPGDTADTTNTFWSATISGALSTFDNDMLVQTASQRIVDSTGSEFVNFSALDANPSRPQNRYFYSFLYAASRTPLQGSRHILRWDTSASPTVRHGTDSFLAIHNGAGTLVVAGTIPLPINTFVRIEAEFERQGDTFHVVVSLYLDPTASTPDETIEGIATSLSVRGDVRGLAMGLIAGSGTQLHPWCIWFDDIQVSTLAMPAPFGTAPESGARPSTITAPYDHSQQIAAFPDPLVEQDRTAEESGQIASTTLDISWFFAEAAAPEEAIEVLIAADVNYQNVEMFSLYPRAPPWDDEYTTVLDPASTIVANRNTDYPSVIAESSPSLYWRLGEPSGNPQDSSGNELHATSISGTPTRDVTGLIFDDDGAVTFDGTSAFQASDVANRLEVVNWGLEESRTVELWFRGSTVGGGILQFLFGKLNAWDNLTGWKIAFDASDNLVVRLGVANDILSIPGAIYLDGEPHHLVVTRECTEPRLTLYIDAVQVATSTNTLVDDNLGNSQNFRVGMGTTEGFVGTIDEVALYGSVLSTTVIQQHYDTGFASLYEAEVLTDSPFLYWRLNDPSGTVAEDASGNDRDGTYINTPTLGVAGLIANDPDEAITLTQANLENVERIVAGVTGGTAFSMECWVKIGAQDDADVIMMESRSTASGPITKVGVATAAGGGIQYQVRRDDAVDQINVTHPVPGLYDDTPHHIVVTDEDVAGTRTYRIYVDGVQVASGTYTRGTYTLHNAITLGARFTGSSHGNWLNGTLDEFALYDHVLSPSRIYEHAKTGGAPITAEIVVAAHDVVFSDYASQFPVSIDRTEVLQTADLLNNDVSWFLTPSTVNIDVSDTIDIDVAGFFSDEYGLPEDETAQVFIVETWVASNYTTFQGTVEALVVPTWDEYLSTTTLDISGFLAGAEPPAPIESLVAANYSEFQGDVEFLTTPGLTIEDASTAVVTDTTFIFATRNVDVTDVINVTVNDVSQVDRLEAIEGLVAANYSDFQGDVEPLRAPTWDDYQPTTTLDVSWFFAGAFIETIEALVAANYSTAQGAVEALSPPVLTVENNGTVSVIDTAFILADRNVDVSDAINVVLDDQAALQVLGGVEDLVAASYTTFQGSVEYLDDPALTIEDYSTAAVLETTFLTAAVSIDVSDTLNITVDDQVTVQQFEGIVGLVAANYSTFYGTVEAFQPPVLTIEDYSSFAVRDVSFILATVNVVVTESINIVLDDTSALTKFEAIEGLVAAGYSTFFGTVEALFPPQTTIENSSSGSNEVPIVSTPTPPQPWGPFTAIVDDYTYTAVADDMYQPMEPEEGG